MLPGMSLALNYQPFMASGGFETGLEGWTVAGTGARISGPGIVRSGTFAVYLQDYSAISIVLPANVTRAVTVGIWVKADAEAVSKNYVISAGPDGGALSDIASGSFTTSYTYISGTFTPASSAPQRVRIETYVNDGSNLAILDDWSIAEA